MKVKLKELILRYYRSGNDETIPSNLNGNKRSENQADLHIIRNHKIGLDKNRKSNSNHTANR